ncbi:MAG: methyltransferase domain-containing protein [Desulfuromonadaceae bacterium]|nr:methyltransferase domain-containing protein [Desulfuromonadaceae bacterium]
MKTFLLPHLICPACLPAEIPLKIDRSREDRGDIVSGKLSCEKCRRIFPIREGIAFLLIDPDSYRGGGQSRYDDTEMVNRYLWSHYADLAGVLSTGEANSAWAECLAETATTALDTGCAVGRLTFEMGSRGRWAVGCDLSLNFVRMARLLATERRCTFSLPLEGNLRESFSFELPEHLCSDTVEFVVANAQALPFARETFQQTASVNLLDRVSYPLAHLYEMNRVAHKAGASFLFADPFSWSAVSTPEDKWLGGTATGPYRGRGLDNVRSLLQGKDRIIAPVWNIIRETRISWAMRTHTNHTEIITSEVLVSTR